MSHILIIDDDQGVRDAFELALADQYEVELATDGQRGINAVTARRPDLIFLDLKMPGIDGVETLRRIRPLAPNVPVYIVTAFAQDYMEPLQQAKADGLRFQLAAKPLTAEQIRMIARASLGGG